MQKFCKILLELTILITVHRLKKTLNLSSIESGRFLNTRGGGVPQFTSKTIIDITKNNEPLKISGFKFLTDPRINFQNLPSSSKTFASVLYVNIATDRRRKMLIQ